VIVNTGMGWEAPHHKRLFDAILPGPTPYTSRPRATSTTWGVSRCPRAGQRYVAQAMNPACQATTRELRVPHRTALIWFGQLGG